MKYFTKAHSLTLTSKNIQNDFKVIDIYPPIDHFKIFNKFPFCELINTISQNNIIEYPIISEIEDIIFIYNLRENSVLNISILNILEKKFVKKKIIDIFDSIIKDLFQFILYTYWMKNHDDKIKDRELKKCHDILRVRKKHKNERWAIMKKHHVVTHKEIMKKLMQVEEVVNVMMKIKRSRVI